jgi:hypothetical protein
MLKEEGTTSAADTTSIGGTESVALSSSALTKNYNSSVSSIVVVDEIVVAATRIKVTGGLEEGQQGNAEIEQQEQQQEEGEQEPQAQSQQAQHHKYDTTDIRHDSNSNNTNHQTITSYPSTTDILTATRRRSNMYDTSSYSLPRTPFARSAEDSNMGSRVPNPLSPPSPPADDSISTSAGITTASTCTNSAGMTFPGGYPPSSIVTRSSNTNSSSSQQRTKPSSPYEQADGRAGAGQDYAAKKRRRITLSTIQALRRCTTYVTRVKTSLLALNHDAEFDAFLELLCNWSDQGLTPKEVFSQMEVILQDVSPELLAAFTTFLPGDTQEKKAKLHIASSASSSRMLPTIRAAHDVDIQEVVSATSDSKHLDSDNDDKVQEEEGYDSPA